jgi:hypothetical protein
MAQMRNRALNISGQLTGKGQQQRQGQSCTGAWDQGNYDREKRLLRCRSTTSPASPISGEECATVEAGSSCPSTRISENVEALSLMSESVLLHSAAPGNSVLFANPEYFVHLCSVRHSIPCSSGRHPCIVRLGNEGGANSDDAVVRWGAHALGTPTAQGGY